MTIAKSVALRTQVPLLAQAAAPRTKRQALRAGTCKLCVRV